MVKVHHIFVNEISKELLEFDHISGNFYFENLIKYLMSTFKVSFLDTDVKEDPRRD